MVRSQASIEKNRKYAREYSRRPKVKVRIKEYHKVYYNKPEVKKHHSEWMKKYYNRPEIKKRHSEYMRNSYEKNKESILKKAKEYWKDYSNRPEVKKRIKEYRQRNKERKNEYIRKHNQRLEVNIRMRLRGSFTEAIRNYSKNGKVKSSSRYGINYRLIIEHLKPFPKDRNNYHIDHIIPLSWFDFNNPKEIVWAFAPENHQWLTIEENLRKSNNFIWVK